MLSHDVNYYSTADFKEVGILVTLHAKQNINGIEIKKANITSGCSKRQALSPDMPIIILSSVIREQ